MVFATAFATAFVTVYGCSDDSDESIGGDVADDDACFKEYASGLHSIDLDQNGISRPFLVYVPESYAGTKMPLILLLHPSVSSGDTMLTTTDSDGQMFFTQHADENGYIIAAPTGAADLLSAFAWNA